jgi:hypothetical protein
LPNTTLFFAGKVMMNSGKPGLPEPAFEAALKSFWMRSLEDFCSSRATWSKIGSDLKCDRTRSSVIRSVIATPNWIVSPSNLTIRCQR